MPETPPTSPESWLVSAQAVDRLLRRLPRLARLLLASIVALGTVTGLQFVWPGTRIANLEADTRGLHAADLQTNLRVDSVSQVLRGHLTDEGVTRRATQIWLCLHSEPAEQDMLQLPCSTLIQNAVTSRARRRAIR